MAEPMTSEQTQRSLWLGDLPQWVDEGYLFNIFVITGQLVSVKLIRNRSSGQSEGYAFLEFRTHEAAAHILQHWNGQPFPNDPGQTFRLNWAAYGVGKASPSGEDFSLFVGDLAPDVTDLILQEYFRQFYPSVRSAKVITDAATGRSKGYGFVRFLSEEQRDAALDGMGGHRLSNRPIRVHLATAKKNAHATTSTSLTAPHPSDFDTSNTTLFIGGLSSSVTEDELRAVFARFGDIIYVKIPAGKGCGFVQYVLRVAAEAAMATMNGQPLGGSAMRISWGRSSSRAATLGAAAAAAAAAAQGLPPHAAPGGFGLPPPGALGGADPRAAAAGAALYDPTGAALVAAAAAQHGGYAAQFAPALLTGGGAAVIGEPYAGVFGVPGLPMSGLGPAGSAGGTVGPSAGAAPAPRFTGVAELYQAFQQQQQQQQQQRQGNGINAGGARFGGFGGPSQGGAPARGVSGGAPNVGGALGPALVPVPQVVPLSNGTAIPAAGSGSGSLARSAGSGPGSDSGAGSAPLAAPPAPGSRGGSPAADDAGAAMSRPAGAVAESGLSAAARGVEAVSGQTGVERGVEPVVPVPGSANAASAQGRDLRPNIFSAFLD